MTKREKEEVARIKLTLRTLIAWLNINLGDSGTNQLLNMLLSEEEKEKSKMIRTATKDKS